MSHASQFRQIAWLVDDLDAAVAHWRAATGAGPFFVGRHIGAMITDMRHRGVPTEIDMSAAVAQAGAVVIELIQQHGSAPSPYRDVYPEGQGGVHHVQAFVDDVAAACATYQDLGYEVVMSGMLAGISPVVYVDTRAAIGCMTELMEREGPASHMYAALAAAAADWDGTDPVREMAALMG